MSPVFLLSSIILLLNVSVESTSSESSQSAPLSLLSTSSPGKCLDGSPSGYYFLPSSNQSETRWTLDLYGGGECFSASSCQAATKGPLGSSKYFPASADFNSYFSDSNPSTNPGFAAWNHVQIAYCSQDLHSGQRTSTSSDTFGLFFSGHLSFKAILDELDLKGFVNATEILVSGESAGGIGMWPNLDYTHIRYPAARVSGAPIAGFYFFAYPYIGPNASKPELANFSPQGIQNLYALYNAKVVSGCATAYASDPSPCMLGNYSFPYINADIFASEAQSDAVVLSAHDNINAADRYLPPEYAYLTQWALNMSIALSPLLSINNLQHGVFTPACWTHTNFNGIKIISATDGLSHTYLEAAFNWYSRNSDPHTYKLSDSLPLMSNPSCPPA